MSDIHNIVSRLYTAELENKPIAPIRFAFPNERDIEAAYTIQQLVTQKKIVDGAKIVGKKIGLTSFAVQKQLGVNEPDFGVLLDNMQLKNLSSIPHTSLMQPKAEAEWAFVLKENLNKSNLQIEELFLAIDYALVAIEIVGSRIENWNIKITDTIADNASASHFVLGNKQIALQDINLVHCKMQMQKNNQLVSQGKGSACMQNPLHAALWLAKKMKQMGTPLQKGEIILSGALGPMTDLQKGDEITASIDDFDTVAFQIT